MNQVLFVVVVGACTLPAMPAGAQPIYRCGPDGREYTQTPCPGGRLVDANDPRSAAQRAEARDVAAREAQLANRMEAQRRDAEARAKPSGASSLSPRPAAKPVRESTPRKSKKNKTTADEPFTATVPKPAKPKSTKPSTGP